MCREMMSVYSWRTSYLLPGTELMVARKHNAQLKLARSTCGQTCLCLHTAGNRPVLVGVVGQGGLQYEPDWLEAVQAEHPDAIWVAQIAASTPLLGGSATAASEQEEPQ